MYSLGAVVILCISLCNAGIIDRVDKVLQNLLVVKSQPQSDGTVENINDFLLHGTQFKNFILDYDKYYQTDEEIENRFNIFRDNLKLIQKYNENELGTATYGVNKFADQTDAEFNSGLSPIDWEKFSSEALKYDQYNASISLRYSEPDPINYRTKGKVLEKVQDQQMCGSCWAHSAVAAIESAHAIKYNKLIELSKQQLVDCDYYDGGCCGGWPFRAFDYIKQAGGLMSEADYKQRYYEGPCKFDQKKTKTNIDKRYVIYSRDTEMNVAQFVDTMKNVGPLVAIINASGFRFYRGGVMNQPDIICEKGAYALNHAVFNVGFDYEVILGKKYPYWIIKNSWGKDWGEDGYIRIAKGHNVCGMEWISTALQVA